MQREQIIGILNSLDTETLIKALGVAGIQLAPEAQAEVMEGGDGKDTITPWNEQRVDVGRSQRPPLHTPEAYLRDEQRASGTKPAQPGYLTEDTPMEQWYVDQASNAQ